MQNRGGRNYHNFDRDLPNGMVHADHGPVAKVKKIAEKNAAKGQNSLSNFFGGKTENGGA